MCWCAGQKLEVCPVPVPWIPGMRPSGTGQSGTGNGTGFSAGIGREWAGIAQLLRDGLHSTDIHKFTYYLIYVQYVRYLSRAIPSIPGWRIAGRDANPGGNPVPSRNFPRDTPLTITNNRRSQLWKRHPLHHRSVTANVKNR